MKNIDIAYSKYCRERFALPSENQVDDLEQRLRVSLPKDYRQYLLQYNGGVFIQEHHIIPPTKDCPLDRLDVMFGIGATPRSLELGNTGDVYASDDNDPPQIMPIGYTIMGNMIILSTHPEDAGGIVLKIAGSYDCFFLADGIEEFFGLLQEPLCD